jgi:hypothetical protein
MEFIFLPHSLLPPMMFMGENLSSFYNGMQNYGTQSMPWASNHFSHGMSDMSSHFPSLSRLLMRIQVLGMGA